MDVCPNTTTIFSNSRVFASILVLTHTCLNSCDESPTDTDFKQKEGNL